MTTSEDRKIDRTIKGDITSGATPRDNQKGPAEFLAGIDSLLALDGVEGLIWDQYTPYFNDGDATEFGTYDVRVIIEGDDDQEDDYRDYDKGRTSYELFTYGDKYPDPGSWPRAADFGGYGSDTYKAVAEAHSKAGGLYRGKDNRVYELGGRDTQPIAEALENFRLYPFYDVVLDNFGDHATVTATKDGFSVEYREHD